MPFAALTSVFASSEYRTVRPLLVVVVMWVAFLCGSGCQLPGPGLEASYLGVGLGRARRWWWRGRPAPSAVGPPVGRAQLRPASEGSPAAAATMAVSWPITASCLSRSRAPALVRTWTRTRVLSPSAWVRQPGPALGAGQTIAGQPAPRSLSCGPSAVTACVPGSVPGAPRRQRAGPGAACSQTGRSWPGSAGPLACSEHAVGVGCGIRDVLDDVPVLD